MIAAVGGSLSETLTAAPLWAGAFGDYFLLQSARRSNGEILLLSQFDPEVSLLSGAEAFISGTLEGFARLLPEPEKIACVQEISQVRLEELASEFPGTRLLRDGRFIALLFNEEEIVRAEEVGLATTAGRIGPGAILPEGAGTLPTRAVRVRSPIRAVRILSDGTLTSGRTTLHLRKGAVYGAPFGLLRVSLSSPNPLPQKEEGFLRSRQVASLVRYLTDLREIHRRSLEVAIREASERSRKEEKEEDLGLIGRSPAILRLREAIRVVARSEATVLILGESGSGKEKVAEAIHRFGTRSEGPFIAVNCGAIPVTLLESELFGHERGAFTGAAAMRRGRFEMAHGGTLFLDEVGELPAPAQVALLRILEEKRITRVGGERPIPVDLRVIAATHRDLKTQVEQGKFREDLFFRLNIIPILVPPLRERREDIPLLIAHFLKEIRKEGRPLKFSRAALDALESYDFPGNVRELSNVVSRCVVFAGGEVIGPELLPPEIVRRADQPRLLETLLENLGWRDIRQGIASSGSLTALLKRIEWQLVKKAIAEEGGNKSRAATLLGRSYRWLIKIQSRQEQSGQGKQL